MSIAYLDLVRDFRYAKTINHVSRRDTHVNNSLILCIQ